MNRWLSWALLLIAYATYGRLLHTTDFEPVSWLSLLGSWIGIHQMNSLVWVMTLLFVGIKASILTVFWTPVRKFMLLGFQSDVGYSIMVLVLASLAVVAVVQIRTFAYITVLIASAILVRVDSLITDMGDRLSFLVLILIPLIGLGLSWLPSLVFRGAEVMT